MPVGYPKDENKRQVWNGSGMAILSKSRRQAIGKASGEKRKDQSSGWPESIQKEGEQHFHTYWLATAEWDRRMAASKSK